MSAQANLIGLKERLEQLFPGKWVKGAIHQRNIMTGLSELDAGVTHGLTRKRIAEWSGPLSSGKSSLLRAIIARWCAAGLHVVYVDKLSRLRPGDWAFVEKGNSGVVPMNMSPRVVDTPGRFVVARNFTGEKPEQDALWAVEQLIRAGIFDVVIFDTAGSLSANSRIYARLQRALERSKAALLVLQDRDAEQSDTSWGYHSKFAFDWAYPVACEKSLSGVISIVPSISCSIFKDGASQKSEVIFRSHVSNRLFTHPQIPDRRTPKARTGAKK